MKDYSGRKDYSGGQETPPYADTARLRARIAELEKKLEPMPDDVSRALVDSWYDDDAAYITLVRRVEAWHEQR